MIRLSKSTLFMIYFCSTASNGDKYLRPQVNHSLLNNQTFDLNVFLRKQNAALHRKGFSKGES